MSIFLSYRRADSELVVGPVYDRLVSHFSIDQVFRDLDSLRFGKPFPQALEEAIATASGHAATGDLPIMPARMLWSVATIGACLAVGVLATILPLKQTTENQKGKDLVLTADRAVRRSDSKTEESAAQEEPLVAPRSAKLNAKEIEIRIMRNADKMGETLVRTLLPNAEPGTTLLQSTKLSEDGNSVEVVIKVQFRSGIVTQHAVCAFEVNADSLQNFAVRDSGWPGTTPEDLQRAQVRLQDVWSRTK
jgi:hypothetical protein